MLHLPNMSILKCSLPKLPPHMNYHSYPLYLDHLQPQHVVATCVTATILKLSGTGHGLSIIIKPMLKMLWISLRWHYLVFLGVVLWLLYFHLLVSWLFLLFSCIPVCCCYWSLKNSHIECCNWPVFLHCQTYLIFWRTKIESQQSSSLLHPICFFKWNWAPATKLKLIEVSKKLPGKNTV